MSTPLLFGPSGPVPTPPATLQADLLAAVAAERPGYTANLPGTLIEDVSSTDVGALVVCDQARVDAVNAVSPYAANAYVLNQQGAMLGIPQGLAANASVLVVISGNPGYVIVPGFIVSDGTHQFLIQDGGAIATGGSTAPLFAISTSSGSFAIPPGTVTTIITSVPSPYALTVTNPEAGIPADSAETVEQYRSRILEGMGVATTGTAAYAKTLLGMVPGVQTRLISIRQVGTLTEIICGGGDPYQTAGAIYQAGFLPGLLTGSTTTIRNVTVSIYDAPDTYTYTYVNPPQQVVTGSVLWNTTLANFTAVAAVNQYIVGAVGAYINGLAVGQPINLMVLTEAVQAAVAPVLSPANLTTLQFSFSIDGVPTPPDAGTSIIVGDPESYFYVAPSGVTSAQG